MNILKSSYFSKSFCILPLIWAISSPSSNGSASSSVWHASWAHRKFILCTNNENNICREVTYERIKRVIDKEDYSASLKYYKVDYIPVSERMYYEYADELLLHIRDLVELENGVNFTGNAEIGIVLTEE